MAEMASSMGSRCAFFSRKNVPYLAECHSNQLTGRNKKVPVRLARHSVGRTIDVLDSIFAPKPNVLSSVTLSVSISTAIGLTPRALFPPVPESAKSGLNAVNAFLLRPDPDAGDEIL